jgi:hypothetical protein
VCKAISQKIGISLSKIIITKVQKGRNGILRIKGITELKFLKNYPSLIKLSLKKIKPEVKFIY